MNPAWPVRITEAAYILGVGPKCLMRELRAKNILNAENFPAQEYIDAGQLSAVLHPYPMGHTGITKFYPSPTVTIKGWPLLETIARDIRHGNKPKVATPVCSGDSSTSHSITAEERHERCAGILQMFDDDARPSDVRAA